MKAVGIVAEYNPLHNGHIYHIEESKKLAGEDAVVVAMSGDYVQRGEPAILDKWERTRHALNHGADVVIEIPTLFCMGNSSQYANAAVSILGKLGAVSCISFGSESGDIEALKRVAENLRKEELLLSQEIAKITKLEGCSFPKARELSYSKLFGDNDIELLRNSNDNLALSYLMANSETHAIAIKRQGSNYSDGIDLDNKFQSATGIREAIKNNESVSDFIPDDVLASLNADNQHITLPDNWLKTLRTLVLSTDPEKIDCCPSGGEGLGNKISAEIMNCDSWDELVKRVKSKRYTYTRISRLIMQIILQINQYDYLDAQPRYIRILGLSKRGRELISEVEKNELNKLPIITNVKKHSQDFDEDARKLLELDIHGADIYNLVTGRNVYNYSDYRMKPIIQE